MLDWVMENNYGTLEGGPTVRLMAMPYFIIAAVLYSAPSR